MAAKKFEFKELQMIDETQVSEIMGLSLRTIQTWRLNKMGPPYIHISSNTIRYLLNDVKHWLQSRRIAG